MRSMKPYMWVVLVVALGVAGLFTASHRFAAQGSGGNNGGGSIKPNYVGPWPTPLTLTDASEGVVVFTAAINADGSIASCIGCDPSHTLHIGTGQYQVAFTRDVRATKGFWRWVQVDTLRISSIDHVTIHNVTCTTADRAGDSKAVWVACFHNKTGYPADTSFFLFDANTTAP